MTRTPAWNAFVWALWLLGCTAPAKDSVGTPAPGTAGDGSGAAGNAGPASAPSSGNDPGSGAGTSSSAAGNGSGDPGGAGNADAGSVAAAPEPPPPSTEMLPDGVDWTAFKVGAADSTGVVHEHMYSAYNGVQTFKVPARVEGATVDLSGWLAVPSSAVTIEPDPDAGDSGGVMITVEEPVAEITIAAMSSDGMLGGVATLHVMEATEQDWLDGEARYNNGVDYVMPMVSFADLLNPNYMPPPTPTDIACNNCHTTGAKYLEIQHTPTQIAYVSDANLITIFTLGMKPAGVAWSLLPMQLQYLYPQFHTWDATMEQQEALIVYLRALTPTPQGAIVIPSTITM